MRGDSFDGNRKTNHDVDLNNRFPVREYVILNENNLFASNVIKLVTSERKINAKRGF